MHDQTSIERQWILLRTLVARRHGISVSDMAREAKVAEKTIRRDLELFQKLGFPLLETNCERGRILPVSVSATTRSTGMLPVSVSSTTHCRLEAASTRRQRLSTEGTERYGKNQSSGRETVMRGASIWKRSVSEAWRTQHCAGFYEFSSDGFSLFGRQIHMRVRLIFGARGIRLEAHVAPEFSCRATSKDDQAGPGEKTRQSCLMRTGERSDIDRETRKLESGRCDPLFSFVPPMGIGNAPI
jgi:hypothetical protein